MKVKIGPYSSRWISNVHDRHMDLKYGRFNWRDNKDREDRAWERVEDTLQWLYNHTINLILDKRSAQKISVRIDNYDTWSMDHTLAHIVLPMLKQLKDTKHGSPFVDKDDVPEHLQPNDEEIKRAEDIGDTDSKHHDRWEWVLDEMIWAFEQKARDDWEGDYYEYEDDPSAMFGLKLVWEDREGSKAHQERMSNGFRLFGKYYEALWD